MIILRTLLRNDLRHYTQPSNGPDVFCPPLETVEPGPAPSRTTQAPVHKVPRPAVLGGRGDPRHAVPRQQIDAHKTLW